jgi:putative ATPase
MTRPVRDKSAILNLKPLNPKPSPRMQPLAERLRPKTLANYVGQEHLVGEQGVLIPAIKAQRLPSMIFWGPPGVGKTTLAHVLASTVDVPFYALSAINSGVKDVREAIANAERGGMFQTKRPILFIDEIHRFSKAQQDSLLGAVERGIVTLIGATTENPSFEVISALLSRCQVYVLEPLGKNELVGMVKMAAGTDAELKQKQIKIKELDALLAYSGGDARRLYNMLEIVVDGLESKSTLDNAAVEKVLQDSRIRYDKGGEEHYDIISAFIKSMRGSDPNASVYWLARMIEGGEDPKFIARRMVILASEDIGNANPNALLLANAAFEAVDKIGMPEGRIILSQCAVYLATSPKSNSTYLAIDKALELVKKTGNLPVPLHLRNAPTKLMKELDYGKNYKYAHDFPGNFVEQEFLPEEISGTTFYNPGTNSREQVTADYLMKIWKGKY